MIKYCLILLLVPVFAFTQKELPKIREGNKAYKDSLFEKAAENYHQALEINPSSAKAQYNLGNAYYQQKKYEDALAMYNKVLTNPSSEVSQANTYYNQGNANLKAGKLNEAVLSYKNALRKNPKHEAARYNLTYAQNMLRQQNQKNQQNKESQDKKKQDQKNKDQQKNKEGKDGDQKKEDQGDKGKQDKNKSKQDGKNKENQEQKNKEQNEQKDAQPEPLKKGELSKEQAEQLLKSLEDNEKAIQKKMIQKELKRKKIEKDW